jgi:hypothetical protein
LQWWARKLIVEHEQARGLREPGVRPDGIFTTGASNTGAARSERAAPFEPVEQHRPMIML